MVVIGFIEARPYSDINERSLKNFPNVGGVMINIDKPWYLAELH
jgi:hypothetical protein